MKFVWLHENPNETKEGFHEEKVERNREGDERERGIGKEKVSKVGRTRGAKSKDYKSF